MSDRLWNSRPLEPRWKAYLPTEGEIALASLTWHSVIELLEMAGRCPLEHRHLVKQLCFARVYAERSARIVREEGAISRAPAGDDVIYSRHWINARKADVLMRRLERRLGLALC